uniref:Uncharacterized protein n=1 Tax=Steinernema glaseri TaxID=37863 RepID=A0A1I7ZFY2_9BILA
MGRMQYYRHRSVLKKKEMNDVNRRLTDRRKKAVGGSIRPRSSSDLSSSSVMKELLISRVESLMMLLNKIGPITASAAFAHKSGPLQNSRRSNCRTTLHRTQEKVRGRESDFGITVSDAQRQICIFIPPIVAAFDEAFTDHGRLQQLWRRTAKVDVKLKGLKLPELKGLYPLSSGIRVHQLIERNHKQGQMAH